MWSPAGAGPTTLPWGQTSLISHIKDDPKMGWSQRSSWPVPPQLGRERQREAGPALRTRALLGLLAGAGQGWRGRFLAQPRRSRTLCPRAVSRQVGGTRSSAVCAFSLKDIERAFEGKYKELNKETSRWTTHGVPDDISPRPGSVSTPYTHTHALNKAPPRQRHAAPSAEHLWWRNKWRRALAAPPVLSAQMHAQSGCPHSTGVQLPLSCGRPPPPSCAHIRRLASGRATVGCAEDHLSYLTGF